MTKEHIKYPLIISTIVSILWFLYGALFSDLMVEITPIDLLINILAMIVIGLFVFLPLWVIINSFLFFRNNKKQNVVRGWKWIFYILGWLEGIYNPIFWVIVYVLFMTKNYGENFFSECLHRRVYKFGIIITVFWLALIALVIAVILFFGA